MHGIGGGWKVTSQRLRWEILEAVQEGAKEFGIQPRADFNDGDNEGSGFFEVNQRKGVRWTTARGFLRPAMKRPNLRVILEAETERLILEGREVRGLVYRHKGARREARADAEVLLAAGSINSPKIMELSGIGQPERLAGLGIDVAHECPGVGENLQDHLQIRTVFGVQNARTLNTLANSAWGKAAIVLEYALWRSGPMSMAPSQFGMFTKSDPALATPDLEYHVQPLVHRPTGRSASSLPRHHGLGLQFAPREPGNLPRDHHGSGGAARDQAELSLDRARPPHRGQLGAAGPPGHDGGCAEALRAEGASSRPRGAVRRRPREGGRQHRDHDLSPRGDVQDGPGRRTPWWTRTCACTG